MYLRPFILDIVQLLVGKFVWLSNHLLEIRKLLDRLNWLNEGVALLVLSLQSKCFDRVRVMHNIDLALDVVQKQHYILV